MNASELDAVTIDAYGTLVTLIDPVPALLDALGRRGVERSAESVRAGFRTEVAYYAQHSATGHDAAGLSRLQRDCARVFLDAVGAELDATEFAPVYAAAMQFEVLPRVEEALAQLQALGLELAVVANWDLTLAPLLEQVGLARHFRTIVHASAKPAPDGLLHALAALDVKPGRALHIGDDEVDALAARAAGTHFAPAPLPEAVATLT